MLAIGAFAFSLLRRQGLLRGTLTVTLSVLFLLLALGARLWVFDHETLDYQMFLAPWVEHFRIHGGFPGFAIPVGNYHVTYLYFLALFSYIPLPDLHLIKLVSVFFDVVLAYYIMQLVGLHTRRPWQKRLAFFVTLFLPTIFLNGAYWGQCDQIYAAFAVMSLYYALTSRPNRSMMAIALAFAFKLQAIFIFPIFLILLYTGRIRIWNMLVFPVTYVLAILPAVFFGRPFMDTLLFYFRHQIVDGRGLNYNSPSIFTLVRGPGHDTTLLATLGIIAAFALVLAICLIVFTRHGRNVSNETFLVLALAFTVGVPLFLPHMHDRYFFMADSFAVALGLTRLRYFPAILATQFASLLGYHAYLRQAFLFPMRYGTFALLALMILLLFALLRGSSERDRL